MVVSWVPPYSPESVDSNHIYSLLLVVDVAVENALPRPSCESSPAANTV